MPRIQAEQSRIVIHYFPEDFTFEDPCSFTDPFRYAPSPAVLAAAKGIIKWIETDSSLSSDLKEGKMIGVMVAISAEGRPCYIAAFSGNIGGRGKVEGFVPPIYDLTNPDGEFKIKEAEITAINNQIKNLTDSDTYRNLLEASSKAEFDRKTEIEQMCTAMAISKKRRNELREQNNESSILDRLIKESQFEKAELRRLKMAWDEKISKLKSEIDAITDEIASLKRMRASMSERLQDWIFRQYIVHNAFGEESSIADIFSSQGIVSPGGTGECAAPKLLEYAYRNSLVPLAMGEFWYGRSPETAVRTHGHFYPSCTSKCGPLLKFMMKGLQLDSESAKEQTAPSIIFEDDAIIIVEKPSGMPSVPGLDGRISLLEWICSHNDSQNIIPVHRLDMDTSGIMLFAKSEECAVNLQRQFKEHSIRKTYIARVSIAFTDQINNSSNGRITLPLSPDYDERPRQKVDFTHGKEADTEYQIVKINDDLTADLLLYPRTGRTHQLRVHCSHSLGLKSPIIGDMLYGGCASTYAASNTSAPRLCLHALSITFRHPKTEEEITFTSDQLRY